MSHTPGPWKVSEHNPLDVVAGKTDVATCAPSKGLDLKRYEERKANALLVAAAPELLTACQEIADNYADGYIHGHASIMKKLRAAIARTKG